MLTLSLPEKTAWDGSFSALTKDTSASMQSAGNLVILRPKSQAEQLDEKRKEQSKLIPLLDAVYDAAMEALTRVSPTEKQKVEVKTIWRSIHRTTSRCLELVCHLREAEEPDHVVLLAAQNYQWHPLLDRLFPSLSVATLPHEHEKDSTVISLDGHRHKTDAIGIPAEVRFIYPQAIAGLKQSLHDPEGPLYDFTFKATRRDGNSQTFQAILRLH